MRAGILRDRLRLERFTAAADAVGAPDRQWQTVGEVQCQILEQSARNIRQSEFLGTGTEVAEAAVQIRLREFPDARIDPAWRGIDVDTGDIYEFIAVSPSRRRNDITIMARRGGTKR